MITQNHHIGRVHLKLSFGSEKNAFHQQDSYLRYFRKRALPALEALLDKYDRPDFVLRIDQLQLNLGVLPRQESKKALIDQFLVQLEKKLVEMVHDPLPANMQWEQIPITSSKLQSISRFLQTGTLPVQISPTNFYQELETLWAQVPEAFFKELVKAYREKGTMVLYRMSHQFDAPLLGRILHQGLGPEWSSQFVNLWNKWIQYDPQAEHQFRSIFWSSALTLAFNPTSSDQKRIEAFWSSLIRQSHQQALPLPNLKKWTPLHWHSTIVKVMEKEPAEEFLSSLETERTDPDISEAPVSDEAAMHYCVNAGLVILHPFFMPFLQEFGLLNTKGDGFKDPASQCKAVYLLHYLATGEWAPPEYQLTLPKLLCGLPLDYPLPRDFTLEESEITESHQLLQAVIQHWGALGKTSEEGLREGYLQREGRLEFKKDHWILKIERKTMDILLDKLPWSSARIKLPWMKHFLRVEWA